MKHTPEPLWRRYLRFWGPRVSEDINEELQFHLDMRQRELEDRGVSSQRAKEEVMARFGSLASARNACLAVGQRRERDERRGERLSGLKHDIAYAVRGLARSPGFAAVVILVLALGVGVNLTIFGFVDAIVLHPLPGIRHPERIVTLTSGSLSYPAYRDFKERSRTVEVGAFRQRSLSIQHGSEPGLATIATVTGNYFRLLGSSAAKGRTLLPEDDRPESARAMVVAYSYWRHALGEDPGLLGKVIQVNGVPFTVVGIGAAGFRGLDVTEQPDAWISMAAWPDVAPSGFAGLTLETRSWSWMTMFGVLKPGVTLPQAEQELKQIGEEMKQSYPGETSRNFIIGLSPASVASLPGSSRGDIVRFFGVLLAVVGAVFLLACANVANLLLARTAHRRREIEVRLTLGASRTRIARQFLTESLVLASISGLVAVGLMMLAVYLLRGFTLPGGMTIEAMNIRPNIRMIAIVFTATFLTGVFLGAVQAAHAVGATSMTTLRESGAAAGRTRSPLQAGLLAAQIALSLVLLVGAGLFTRSLQRALELDPGFRTSNLLSAKVDVGLARYTESRAEQFYAEAIERINRLPGVTSASWSSANLLTGEENINTLVVPGYVPAEDEAMEVEYNVVSRDFLPTMGIPLIRGNNFPAKGTLATRREVVISEAMSKRYWPGRDAVGQTVIASGDTNTVIGIARDARYHTLTDEPIPYMYLPLEGRAIGLGSSTISLVIHTSGDPDNLVGDVRRELHSVGPQVPVFDIGTVNLTLNQLLFPQRTGVSLLGAFGFLALVVATMGVYGVVGFVVARRVREVGIRMALGEASSSVVWRMVKDNLGPILGGMIVGLGLAVLLGRTIASFLYGVSPADPVTYLATIGILLLSSVIAALVPARRASRVSPMMALRSE